MIFIVEIFSMLISLMFRMMVTPLMLCVRGSGEYLSEKLLLNRVSNGSASLSVRCVS